MVDALDKAFDGLQRSYTRARQAATDARDGGVLAGLAGGTARSGSSNMGHRQQYTYGAKGWLYVVIKTIAQRVARQQCYVAKVAGKPSARRSKNVDDEDDARIRLKNSLPASLKSIADDIEAIPQHPLLDALQEPNPLMVPWVLSFCTVSSLLITGKAYLWMRDTPAGKQFWPLPAHWVEAQHDDGLYAGWKITPDGSSEAIELQAYEVIPFVLPDAGDPFFGSVSPLASQSRAILADEAIQTSQTAAFQNGIFPHYAVKLGNVPGSSERMHATQKQREQIFSAVKKIYQGALASGEPFILDGLIESISKISNSPSEMDWLDSGKQVKGRIFQAFGVNPFIVGESAPSSYAQAVIVERLFCSNVINPILELMGQVFTVRVAPHFAKGNERLIVWFDVAEAVDEDLILQKWQIAINAKSVTINELRRCVLNLPDTPGGDMLVGAADDFHNLIDQRVNQAMGRMASQSVFSNGRAHP